MHYLGAAEMKPDAEGKVPYTGAADCAMKTLKNHGPLQFYSGFSTYIVRWACCAPVCVAALQQH